MKILTISSIFFLILVVFSCKSNKEVNKQKIHYKADSISNQHIELKSESSEKKEEVKTNSLTIEFGPDTTGQNAKFVKEVIDAIQGKKETPPKSKPNLKSATFNQTEKKSDSKDRKVDSLADSSTKVSNEGAIENTDKKVDTSWWLPIYNWIVGFIAIALLIAGWIGYKRYRRLKNIKDGLV